MRPGAGVFQSQLYRVPCEVGGEHWWKFTDSVLDVYACYYPGYPGSRLDPAEPAGYEVESVWLTLSEAMQAFLQDETMCVRVDGGSRAWVNPKSDWTVGATVAIDDTDLNDEIDQWLRRNA